MNSSAAIMGQNINDLDTPALLLNGPACERNLCTMAEFFRGKPCQLRPHFKNHKCVTLARKQLAAGSAVGMCCAKLGEAEVLAEHGFEDVLIANQVVGEAKMPRLVAVAKRCRLRVAVDDLVQAQAIARAASAAGVVVGLLIEVDIGMGRCGILPGEPALRLAQEVMKLGRGVRFDGLQAYEGHAVYIDDPAERGRQSTSAMGQAIETRALLESKGIGVSVISGGSSATSPVVGLLPGVTEMQTGTYATMDWRYHQLAPQFEVAMTVLARVISTPREGTAVLDVGVKGAGDEFGPPRVKDHPGAQIPVFIAEEHCVVKSAGGPLGWRIGEAVHLMASHACTTCNLHRQFIVHDGQRVVDVWPIEASGRLT